eukprot:TRINITY_DN1908_c0_g1_i1.p1 TRINITY_DN1908_c0_g1~~TRINITY_DN1908_c0_g1_i1.p1  ORF type:complete len:169 (+),score=39.48 TRINITY_DN1908_c0_g1_i1:97-603(+)
MDEPWEDVMKTLEEMRAEIRSMTERLNGLDAKVGLMQQNCFRMKEAKLEDGSKKEGHHESPTASKTKDEDERDGKDDERLFRKVLNSKPPWFAGKGDKIGEAISWIKALENIIEALHITLDEQKIRLARGSLKGAAQQWYQSTKNQIRTYEDFKDSFIANFERAKSMH